MLKKLILIVAIFLVILLALSFGETVFGEVFAWISSLTGVLIRNFGDLYYAAADYLRAHTGKVLLALALTVPASLWILRSRGETLGRPPASARSPSCWPCFWAGWARTVSIWARSAGAWVC